jgi:circadian clock protein KaiB
MIKLRLYIVGKTKRAEDTIKSVHDIFNGDGMEDYSLEVIDVVDDPDFAGKDRIFATPTLVKVFPEPARRIVGDLGKKDLVLHALGLVNIG